jgi:hypothetical protein
VRDEFNKLQAFIRVHLGSAKHKCATWLRCLEKSGFYKLNIWVYGLRRGTEGGKGVSGAAARGGQHSQGAAK